MAQLIETKSPPYSSRDADSYAWLLDQAQRLRDCQPEVVDWRGLAEELEDLMAQQRVKVLSLLRVILAHLLRWQYSKICRSEHSWQKTLLAARAEVGDIFDESATLRNELSAFVAKAYEGASRFAGTEMRLDKHEWQRLFPASCPWTVSEILSQDFLPTISPSANGRS